MIGPPWTHANMYTVTDAGQCYRYLTPLPFHRRVFGQPLNLFHGLRRICPGRFFAGETLALLCASVLHAFDIKPPVDENGRAQKIEYEVTNDSILS